MKKYVVQGSFGFDHLEMIDAPAPEPGPGQVVVKVKAVSLNYRDLMTVQGLYNPNQPLPLTPLSDGCGEVAAVGPGVTRVSTGDRVCTCFFQKWVKGTPTPAEARGTLGGPLDGTLAEFMLADEQGLVTPPAHLSDEEAATLPCAALTAWTALIELGGLRAGQTVLTMGSGGVAVFGLQFAKMAGARVIALSSTPEKCERLKSLGADAAVNYREVPEWHKPVRELTGGDGVDHVLELGGKETLEQSLRSARIRGRVSIIGNLSGINASLNLRHFIAGALTVQGIFVGPRINFENMDRAISQHGLKPVVDRVFPFAEAREAMRHMTDKKHFGKVVVRVE